MTGVGLVTPIDPILQFTPADFSLQLYSGQRATRTMQFTNSGGGDLVLHLAANVLPAGTGAVTIEGEPAPDTRRHAPSAGTSTQPWIFLDHDIAVIPPGGTLSVHLTIESGDLQGGDHEAVVTLTSNDPDHATVQIPVHLHVTSVPRASVQPPILDFGTVSFGSSVASTLYVANIGAETVHIVKVQPNHPLLAVDPSTFTIPAGEFMQVAVSLRAQDAGRFDASITIVSDDPLTPQIVIPVTAEVVKPPQIQISPTSVDVSLRAGLRMTQALGILDTGTTTLAWSGEVLSPSSPAVDRWLSTNVLEGLVPPSGRRNILLYLNATQVNPGNYTASLKILSNDPDAPIKFVPIVLHVQPCDTGPPGPVEGLRFDPDKITLEWQASDQSLAYDVVRGELAPLLTSGGDYASAIIGCMSPHGSATFAFEYDAPIRGGVFFYLVRGIGCVEARGTYDDGGSGQLRSPDPGIQSSPFACP
jgi:hypothetical protein